MSDGVNDRMEIPALLRAAADGELNAEQQARLDDHLRKHPEDEARISFERQLREACGRVMGPSTTPAGLHDRVVARLASEAAHDEVVADRIEARTGETRDQSFWNRVNPMAQALAAAILLLVGGVFLFQMINIGSGGVSPAQAHMSEIASFVGDEHDRCVKDPTRAAKFVIKEIDQAPALLEEMVGQSISPANLTIGGLTFRDGGRCGVPGRGESVHLRFDIVDDPDNRTVSLFIQRVAAEGDKMFEDGKSYELQSDKQELNHSVYGWTTEGLNYFLVAEDRELCESVRIEAGLEPSNG